MIIRVKPKNNNIMKKIYTYLAAAFVSATSMTASAANDEVVTFEGDYFTALIDNPQYYGPQLYGDGSYNWTDATTTLSSELTNAWGDGMFWGGGVAISNYIDDDLANGDFNHQLAVPYSNGSSNFAVAYGDNSYIYFNDGKSRVIKSIDIAPTTYLLNVEKNGNGFGSALENVGGWFKVTITADNEKSIDVYLCKDGIVTETWQTVDLSFLGEVMMLTFTFSGSDSGDYGVNTPAYFAFDNVTIKGADGGSELKVATLEDVVTVEGTPLAADSHMPQLTEDYDEEYGFQSGDFWFDMMTMSDWNSWYGYGVANHTATSYTSLDEQFNSITGAGVDGSANYGVAYVAEFNGPSYVTLSTTDAAVVPGVYVTNAAYAYTSMVNGDSFAKKFGAGDWFKLTAIGFDDADEETGRADFYLADFRSENKDDWYIVNDWYYMDLSTLGAVRSIQFTLSSTDTGSWGMNTPAYFCYDNLGATGTQVTPEGNYGTLTPITNVSTAATAAQRYDILGRRTNAGRGIQIIRNANGTVRKVLK